MTIKKKAEQQERFAKKNARGATSGKGQSIEKRWFPRQTVGVNRDELPKSEKKRKGEREKAVWGKRMVFGTQN